VSGAVHGRNKGCAARRYVVHACTLDRAGNEADLAIYPGGAHGFTLFPTDLSKSATAKMDAFLNRVLD